MNAEQRLLVLIDRYFDEVLTVDEAAELNDCLAAFESARELFWRAARLHARLRQWGEQRLGRLRDETKLDDSDVCAAAFRRTRRGRLPVSRRRAIFLGAMAALIVISLLALWWWPGADQINGGRFGEHQVARFSTLEEVRWVGIEEPRVGDPLHAGERVEIAAGKVGIDFQSGAAVTLIGPAMFEVASETAAYLALGRLEAKADTPASRGFTIRTRTARVVDLGTEFSAEAGADGQSRIEVRSGAVEVTASDRRHLLRTGDTLLVEPGASRVVVRIERGDETPAFRFPSIEPPSDRDYADARQGHARITVARGTLAVRRDHPETGSGLVEALLDGHGQRGQDSPQDSVFFANQSEGMLLLDLGRVVSVSKINTFSWHQNQRVTDNRLRAQQQYVLYGFAGDAVPPMDRPLEGAGWVRIARVNTDEFFGVAARLDRPAQQACSITSATGTLGHYRYLLWDVTPSRFPDYRIPNHTFYGEFDVYARP